MNICDKEKNKNLRHVHRDIAREIKSRPYMVPDDIFYMFMKAKPYQLKPPAKIRSQYNQVTPMKHSREAKDYSFRSQTPRTKQCAPKTPDLSSRSFAEKALGMNIYENTNNNLSDLQNYSYLNKHSTEKNDYKLRYNKIFKGKISKNYLKYLT